ncbi:hypothetical protein HII36_36065 [Nonomuraea sp. NN258]|uniref:hypothetical protein n=1 Tax=Nonomuraea antri TaxID=2730852 RepID=UPI001569BE01|nr:hypothetical protein [Nonomuraea antri]NRQ37215.1 hypothetical protein [Nonomuraea antri]
MNSSALRGSVVVIASALAVAVIAGGAFLLTRTAGAPATGRADTVLARAAVFADPVPLAQAAPAAFRTVPATLPDGRAFSPQAFLDDDTILVTTESSFEKTDAFLAYDLADGRVRKIAEVHTPGTATIFAADITAGHGHIAWWTARRAAGAEIVEVWTVPATGGEPALRGAVSVTNRMERRVTGLSLTPDTLAFSVGNAGVFQAPLATGQARTVPGTAGQHVLSWPWIGSPGLLRHDAAAFQKLRNVQTGEVRDAADGYACGLNRCVPEKGGQVTARNGTPDRVLPFEAVGKRLFRDRFAFGTDRTLGLLMADLDTGRVLDLGVRPDAKGTLFASDPKPDGRMLTYRIKAGEQIVIDLAAIR